MRKFTKKDIRWMIRNDLAIDITNYSFEDCVKLKENCDLDKEGYCSGVYGITGGLLKDTKTGEFYAITARNATLLYFF